jgi:citrate lyase subunit beta/citryl-CoA lyase
MIAGTVALFVPGDRPDRFGKATAAGADIVIVDLEDAVSPSRKDAARSALRAAAVNWSQLMIRINGTTTSFHDEDLALVAELGPAAIMVPKAEDADAFNRLPGNVPAIALIESARGLANARNLAALEGVARLAFGSIDFCADLGCAHEPEPLLFARSELVLASRLAGIPAPLDGVTSNIHDAPLVEIEARHARTLGMGGKLCIHPAQIAPCRAGFRPSDAEIAWARSILVDSGSGVATVGGQMVDAPVRRRAEAILAQVAVS